MSEPKVNEKKMVRRSVAIVLGTICIILVASLVGGFGYFMLEVDDRDNTISSLTSQISSKDSQISQLNTQISDQNNTIFSLNSIINLEKYTYWVNDKSVSQPASSYTSWKFSTNTSGIVVVDLFNSTSSTTYVRVIYETIGWTFDNQIVVGTNGNAAFAVLPSSNVEIRVGNSNLLEGATEELEVIYRY
jgi:hypothetical protein